MKLTSLDLKKEYNPLLEGFEDIVVTATFKDVETGKVYTDEKHLDEREAHELILKAIYNGEMFAHPTEEEIEEMQRAFDRDYGDLS